VQNFGIGFTEEERRHVVEPGYRGRLARNELTFGSGLGLAEVVRSLRLHGGRFNIESRPLHDTTFLTTATLLFPNETNVRSRFDDAFNPVDR
jgi:signal transduction histidine kinase